MTIKKSFQENSKVFYKSVIPSDWDTPEFGTIFSFIKSFSFSREQLSDEMTANGIQYIHYGDIHAKFENEVLDFEFEKRIPFLREGLISKDDSEDDDFPLLKDGDLIIADASEDYEGVCNCVELKNINGRKVISGLHTFAARGKNEIIALGFRTYSLNNQQVVRELWRIATGISVYSVSKTNLSKVKLPLPPLPEQKRIAQVLSLMDSYINKNNQLIAYKELQTKWLMQNLLTGKKRLMGFNQKWEEKHLGDMFSERIETRYLNLQLLSVGASGIYPQSDSIKKDTSNEDKSNYKRICPGDIGYNTMRMWQGRNALSSLEGIVSPAYTIVTPKINTDSLFFSYLFQTSKMMNLFWRNSQGLVDDTLNCKFKDFAIIKISLPEKDEQTEIAQVLQTAVKEIQLLKIKTEYLRTQKKGLMQQLLSGKKRI